MVLLHILTVFIILYKKKMYVESINVFFENIVKKLSFLNNGSSIKVNSKTSVSSVLLNVPIPQKLYTSGIIYCTRGMYNGTPSGDAIS